MEFAYVVKSISQVLFFDWIEGPSQVITLGEWELTSGTFLTILEEVFLAAPLLSLANSLY